MCVCVRAEIKCVHVCEGACKNASKPHFTVYMYISWSIDSSGTVKNKPELHMLGVDKLDQLMSYYCFLHKSVKWCRKVFFWVQEVAVTYIVYNELALKRGESPMSHLAFQRCLIEHLSERMSCPPRSRSGHLVAQNIEHL